MYMFVFALGLLAPPVVAPQNTQTDTSNKVSQGNIDFAERKEVAKFSFEFSKAEIMDVVKAISDITRHNFIVPEKIKGQHLSILSPTKITASEAYHVFFTALAANGISIVHSGKFYKLVDSREAMRDVIPTCVDGNQSECMFLSEQMVTFLLHLNHTDASQISAVAKALVSKDGDVTVFQPSNALIISEYSPNLQRVRDIIAALDVPGFNDELRLIQIQYASSAEIAEKITQIFDVQAAKNTNPGVMRRDIQQQGSAQGEDQEVQISKVVADDRTNQLIIKANRRSFNAIKNLIAKLDVPLSETDQGRVHVYYLENAKAEDLAATLSSLSQGQPNSQARKGAAPTLSPTNPGNAQAAPKSPENVAASLFEGDVKITADKATNSLLIMSSAHDFRSLRSIIEKLDMPRRQVYVEAAILEVNLTDSNEAGIDWHAPAKFGAGQLGPLPSNQAIGFFQSAYTANSSSPTLTALTSPTALLAAAGGSVAGIIGKGITIPIADGNVGDTVTLPAFGVILKWLQSTSNANILSTPHILTTDNEQAHIEVGSKIPFNTGLFGGAASALSALPTSTSTSTAVNPAASALGSLGGGLGGGLGVLGALGGGSVQRIDVSLKLTMTPQINERNKIRLEIEQTLEDVIGEEARTQTPTTAHRSIKTVVVVDDQQTIVLGGLMRDRNTESESKIPILGDLPLLGWFFKQHHSKAEKVSLLLVLTPYIINSPTDFQRIFERKMQEQEEFAAEFYGNRKEYRAHIDYSKKTGPLGQLISTLRREHDRLENGGEGDGSETLVRPKRHLPSPDADDQSEAQPQVQSLQAEPTEENSDETDTDTKE